MLVFEETFWCNTPSFKNSRETIRAGNRCILRLSTRAQNAKIVYQELFEPVYEQLGTLKGLYEVRFFFYRKDARRFDYINLAQGILDGLVDAKILEDDSALFVIPSFEGFEKTGQNGFRLKIFRLTPSLEPDTISNKTAS